MAQWLWQWTFTQRTWVQFPLELVGGVENRIGPKLILCTREVPLHLGIPDP